MIDNNFQDYPFSHNSYTNMNSHFECQWHFRHNFSDFVHWRISNSGSCQFLAPIVSNPGFFISRNMLGVRHYKCSYLFCIRRQTAVDFYTRWTLNAKEQSIKSICIDCLYAENGQQKWNTKQTPRNSGIGISNTISPCITSTLKLHKYTCSKLLLLLIEKKAIEAEPTYEAVIRLKAMG